MLRGATILIRVHLLLVRLHPCFSCCADARLDTDDRFPTDDTALDGAFFTVRVIAFLVRVHPCSLSGASTAPMREGFEGDDTEDHG